MWNISWWQRWWVTVLLPYLLKPHRTGFAWSFAPVLRNCIFWTAAPLLGNQLALSLVSRGHQRFPPLHPRSSNQTQACLSRAIRGREPECCRPHPACTVEGGRNPPQAPGCSGPPRPWQLRGWRGGRGGCTGRGVPSGHSRFSTCHCPVAHTCSCCLLQVRVPGGVTKYATPVSPRWKRVTFEGVGFCSETNTLRSQTRALCLLQRCANCGA